MRISELVGLTEADLAHKLRKTPRVVRLSNRFLSAWPKFAKSYPDLEKHFTAFLRAKALWDPPRESGKHDKVLGTNIRYMSGIMHSHMIFGQAILIYKVDANNVTVYAITDHHAVEQNGLPATATMIRDLDRLAQWNEMPVPDEPVDSDTVEIAHELFSHMGYGKEQNVLRLFAQGNKHSGMEAYIDLMPPLAGVDIAILRRLARSFLSGS